MVQEFADGMGLPMLKRPVLDGAKISWSQPVIYMLGWWTAALIRHLRGMTDASRSAVIATITILVATYAMALVQRFVTKVRQSREQR